MQTERRRHPRFQAKDNAFAVISADPVKLVPIIDISMGGLSIYLDNNAGQPDPLSKMEIMVADCSFYLEKLPFHIVDDNKAFPNGNASLMNGHRYGIKFGNLEPRQKNQLKYFVRRYTEKGSFTRMLHRLGSIFDPIRAPKPTSRSCNTGIWHSLPKSSL